VREYLQVILQVR